MQDNAENGASRYCPECGYRVTKAGTVRVNRSGDTKQLWHCRNCGRRTLNPVSRVGPKTEVLCEEESRT